MIALKRMRWAGHVTHIRISGMHTGLWKESQKERDDKEDPDVVEGII
jgi:hypothetical protein